MKRRDRAFTFVEILAAMLFLGITIPAVVGALTMSNRVAAVSERSAVATQLGENYLAELMVADTWSSSGARGDFGADYPGYRYELVQRDWQNGAMTELALTVFFQVQGREYQVELSTLVNEDLTQAAASESTTATP
jgi:Tfp pilus assembly protein PilV